MPHTLDSASIHQELLKIAHKDGIVSQDEQELIDSISENIKKYYSILDEYYEDDMISSQEHHSLHSARQIIMDQALDIAKSDDQVTQDEFSILNALKDILTGLEDDEHY